MQKILGKEIAQGIIERLKKMERPKKYLAAILVGADPGSLNFIEQKRKLAAALGVDFRLYRFARDVKNDFLRKEIGRIAAQKKTGGVIIQLPLPEGLNRHYVLNAVPKEKDLDVLGERALGSFYTGRQLVLPPAVGTLEEILKFTGFDLYGADVAVVGAGLLIGRPIALWLLGRCRNLTVIDSRGDASLVSRADLVVLGAGQPGLVSRAALKPGAKVVDFGYALDASGRVSGDFKIPSQESAEEAGGWYTPTPGGTGPVLVAKILENFFLLNQDA